ncbi:hypothetical protein CPJCM30710_16790 [Clostridium polyendosporum]|uniref:Prolow-density lipoprotein receptor-related protein 1-like beta-propeller domain-containing protein n=1 Tax=Clostridium polyendosporum TaxID=69208 RepID=A0A919VLX1_9CLOT|nr:DUF5050 domain-containing protein [Clostridium polyendosporum]GIM29013.1 hypothetical protein CPJCM30710_16790 [Clostridium polyendosporum]
MKKKHIPLPIIYNIIAAIAFFSHYVIYFKYLKVIPTVQAIEQTTNISKKQLKEYITLSPSSLTVPINKSKQAPSLLRLSQISLREMTASQVLSKTFYEPTLQGNMRNGGFITYNEPYIYFSTIIALEKQIYRVMSDGSTMMKKLNIPAGKMMCIINNTLYYITLNETLTKTSLTGEDTINIDDTCISYYIYKDIIYYLKPEKKCVFRIHINGQKLDPIQLKEDILYVSNLVVINDKIYLQTITQMNFKNTENNTNNWSSFLYSMNLDGTRLTKVLNDTILNFIVDNDYIYYSRSHITKGDTSSNNKVYLIQYNIKTCNKKTLFSYASTNTNCIPFNLDKNHIYFIANDVRNYENNDFFLKKYNLNTKTISNVSKDNLYPGQIFLVKDRIFLFPIYITDKNSYIFYTIKTDGSEGRFIR